MWNISWRLKAAGLAMQGLLAAPVWADTLMIGGTGGATEAMRAIGARYTRSSGTGVEVLAGLGSGGGINATVDGVLHVAISGRPLSPVEQSKKVATQFEVCTPYVFASSHVGATALDPAAVPAIFARIDPVWPDGTPLRIVLRPQAESDNLTLTTLFPGMDTAVAAARRRNTVPIAATDQDNADLGEKIPGSLIGTTLMQMATEKRALKLVPIAGVMPAAATYETRQYPYGKHLYFVTSEPPAPGTRAFLAFLRSPMGAGALRDVGMMPCVETAAGTH